MTPEPLQPPRFREEVARTARLAAPLAAGHLSHGLVGFVDAVVAGHHGTATLAAVAVGTALFWLPMMLPMGVLMALPPSVSQLDGAGRRGEIGPLFRQALWLAVALGVLLFGLMTVLPFALAPMGMAADIIPGATDFIHAIRWGIPAFTLYLAMRYLSDGLHWSMPTMVLGFGGLLLLAPLGYVLANGLFGFPELGAVGLGIASALMFWVQAIAFALYLWWSPRFADLQLFSHWHAPRWSVQRDLLRTGLPIGVMVAMEGSLFIVTALLIGRLGELPVHVTNQVPNTGGATPKNIAILGDWSQVMLGVWSEADLLVNPYAEGPYKRGAVLIRIMATVDIAMRHPEAFVVASDLA